MNPPRKKRKTPLSEPPRRVAFLLPPGPFYDRMRDIVLPFLQARRNWIILTDYLAPEVLQSLGVEVIVGRFDPISFSYLRDFAKPEEVCASYHQLDVPILHLLAHPTTPEAPYIEVDHQAVSECAAEYFMARGFRHLGFVGYAGDIDPLTRALQPAPELGVMPRRRDTFLAALKGRAESVSVAPAYHAFTEVWRRPLETWLRALPKPVGILAVSDLIGRMVIQSCHLAGLYVPEEISVLGVDDDERVCESCRPTLSSIVIPWTRLGDEILQALDAFFDTGTLPARTVLIPPVGVKARGSTSASACQDRTVSSMLSLIRKHCTEPCNIKEILSLGHLHRRQIDRQFSAIVGRTPYEELCRLRVERAQPLLGTTSMTHAEIAQTCGFSGTTHMRRIFLKQTGKSPDDWRSPTARRPGRKG
ncbi:MAG: substrate-binding domain-containing protein [Kiritimatiellia bacterium]|nr:substrate-binding domain-containing protein [Kiritimatiellia bacterium]